ncbi:MAG: permease-like cell division protein FtsX, partial [Candidatus Peribacteraceae bacterium]
MLHVNENFSVLWKRGILRGLTTARRKGRWLTAFGALFGVLLLLQIVLFGIVGVHTVQKILRAQTDLRLEVRPGAQDNEIQNFFAALQQLPIIDEAVYITKEQAYEKAREFDPELVAFLEKFQMENPFSDTIGVTLVALDDYQEFVNFIEQERWRAVVDPTFLSQVTDQEKQVHELLGITQAGRILAILILFLTGSVTLFIVTELVRRRSSDRSDEVFVERLAGAHPITIILPFATETTVLLWLAVLASALVLTVALIGLPLVFPSLQQ